MFEDPVFIVAANLSVAVLIRIMKPNLLSAALLAIVLIGSTGYLGTHHGSQVVSAVHRGRDAALTWTGHPPTWPPEKNRTYPDLELLDQDGNVTRLSDFKGKVILIEPIGIPCQACVAFSGGHEFGAFEGIEPQADLESIEFYAKQYGHVRLDDYRIVRVQLLLFNQDMQAPTQAEAKAWADHFRMRQAGKEIVLVGTASMATKASRDLIPGFQLIDKHFILRADSTGQTPADDLYTKLLPQIRKLIDED
ncbi:MAG: hypothetical protein H6821_02250 [Planctomycetaceae bacterium]|nr:hypothetical protein [Planctomycetales bacterium]MCB9872975.1 hypothetical protein [Planctomycetaceae bacterium]MCB9937564.1 hypothetical protein [Planctomycetaceae bacterium]HRX79276.1 hypothetical protein [Pirellulaceae bacterium]